MPVLHRDGADLHWRLDGPLEAQPLVLLNSIGVDLHLWDAVVGQLEDRYRILRLDTRGHGRSSATDGDYDLDQLARDVLSIMDAAGVQRAAICGLSLGGMIAMALAHACPERTRALVLACTSAAMDRQAWADRVASVRAHGLAAIADLALNRFFSEAFRREHPAEVDTVRRRLLAMDPRGYAGCAAAIRDMALLERLNAIDTPALVIAGETDRSTPFHGHGDQIMAALAGPRSHITLPAGHLACLEAPVAFAQALDRFLAPFPTPATTSWDLVRGYL